jgi:uncharacterized protein involved in exopolysaccharide biosynthesis
MSIENKSLEERIESLSNKLNEIKSVLPPVYVGADTRDDEIDLRELWNVIWQGKWVTVGVTFVFAVISVIYALSLPNIYRSEVLLAPAEENSGGGLAGMAGQLGGLASLAGVSLEGGGANKTVLALEVLKSREFISYFIRKHDLLVPLMAAEGWDRKNNELIINSDDYDIKKETWVRDVSFPKKPKPSMQEAYERFLECFSVSQNKETYFVLLEFEFFSPTVSKQWVDWLVEDINDALKARDVDEAERSIKYLTGQLEKTPIADMHAIFYELIEEQTKTVMFAEVRDEYVFKTIDGAVAPELKSNPKRALIFALGVILGGLLSIVSLFFRHFGRRNI